jgi:ribonucleoside-diphosphate reductase beta chain
MPNIFEKRVNFKPFEYPQLIPFADSINKSYWLVSEFNFTEDIQDFKVKLSSAEKSVIERAMLAISQIETNVKTYWADLYKRLPKPEVAVVGMTFAESEVRHERAYAQLLEVLGLNDKFEEILEVPAIKGRINYLSKYLDGTRSKDDRVYTKTILLFSMFIEHVSLFSQFLIIMAFNKEKNLLKGVSNVVEATSLEEQVHGLFGAEIINIIRGEHPEWFDDEMTDMIRSACMKAYKAECDIVDWMYEEGDLDFLPKEVVKEFIKNRFNVVLKNGKFDPAFDVDSKMLETTDWFEVQLTSVKEDDFFYKTSNAYNKKSKSITEDDLF